MIYGFLYRTIMKITHKYNWHYAPPCYSDDDTMLRCGWCGFSEVIKRKTNNNVGLDGPKTYKLIRRF